MCKTVWLASSSRTLKGADLRRSAGSCGSLVHATVPECPQRTASLRRRVRTCVTTGALLTSVLLERVSYFSVVGNLVLFCTNELALSSAVGVTVDLVFIGSYSTQPGHPCVGSGRWHAVTTGAGGIA